MAHHNTNNQQSKCDTNQQPKPKNHTNLFSTGYDCSHANPKPLDSQSQDPGLVQAAFC